MDIDIVNVPEFQNDQLSRAYLADNAEVPKKLFHMHGRMLSPPTNFLGRNIRAAAAACLENQEFRTLNPKPITFNHT
jgi:hypothetical protein